MKKLILALFLVSSIVSAQEENFSVRGRSETYCNTSEKEIVAMAERDAKRLAEVECQKMGRDFSVVQQSRFEIIFVQYGHCWSENESLAIVEGIFSCKQKKELSCIYPEIICYDWGNLKHCATDCN